MESPANSEAAEDIDCLIAEIYSHLNALAPKDRIFAVTRLIQLPGLVALRLNTPSVDQDIEMTLGKKSLRAVQRKIADIHALLAGAGLDLSYLAANYWSPAVNHRQSIIACHPGFSTDRLRNRFAIAFFAITFDAQQADKQSAGGEPPGTLRSLVQYLALKAPQRRSVITLNTRDRGPVWDRSLELSGIDLNVASPEFVNALAAFILQHASNYQDGVGDSDGNILGEYLRRGEDLPRPEAWAEIPWLQPILDGYRRIHSEALRKLLATRPSALTLTRERLSQLFDDNTLTPSQIGFFLGMQVVWQRAFGGRYLYAFPTVINDKCCVLTAGANEPLEARSLLASFGRSLFANALFLDYGSSRDTMQRRHYESFVAHNIPKVVISPATAELKRIRAQVEALESSFESETTSSTADEGSPPADPIASQLQSLETLYEHYESLIGRFRFIHRSSGTAGLPTFPEHVVFKREIFPRLSAVFDVLKQRILNKQLRERLVLRDDSLRETSFYADVDMITEILINFIANAMDSIEPEKVQHWPDAASISISACELPGPSRMVQFRVRDCGKGFTPKSLRHMQRIIREFSWVTRDAWGDLLEKYLNRREWQPNAFENLGIGTPLCAAYARQLQWDPHYGKEGSIEIQSTQGNGSEVILTLPVGNETAPRRVAPPSPIREETATADVVAAKTYLLTESQTVMSAWSQQVPEISQCDQATDIPDEAHVVIDGLWKSPEFPRLYELDMLDLMDRFGEPQYLETLPKSAVALLYLSRRRDKGDTDRRILFLCDTPPVALTQELLRAGADWVCSSRLDPPPLKEVYSALRATTRSPMRARGAKASRSDSHCRASGCS